MSGLVRRVYYEAKGKRTRGEPLSDAEKAVIELVPAIQRVLAIARNDDRTMGDVCDAVGREFGTE